jgi:type VI secretion system protein ImpF
MSRLAPHQRLTPSILDRLTADPETNHTSSGMMFDLRQMVDAVRRDLEDLLNTRRAAPAGVEAFEEVRGSVVAFGMPDLSSVPAGTEGEREEVGRVIEGVINRFEPRLREVRAQLVESTNGRERSVRFHIQARLAVDPSPEVGFDTVLELTTGYASVKRSEG